MICLSRWIEILESFESKYNKSQIRNIILSECLEVPVKLYGSWFVNSEKVWNRIVASDSKCLENCKKRRINNGTDIERWYENQCYHAMRSTYPKRKSRR